MGCDWSAMTAKSVARLAAKQVHSSLPHVKIGHAPVPALAIPSPPRHVATHGYVLPPTWTFHTDSGGVLTRMDAHAEIALGFTSDDATGRHFADLFLEGALRYMHKHCFLRAFRRRHGACLAEQRKYLCGRLRSHPRAPWYVRTASGGTRRVHVKLFECHSDKRPSEVWRCELSPCAPATARHDEAAAVLCPRLTAAARSPLVAFPVASPPRTVGVISAHCNWHGDAARSREAGCNGALIQLLRKTSDAIVRTWAPVVIEYTRNTLEDFMFLVNQKWWFRWNVPRAHVEAVTVLLAVYIAQLFETQCKSFSPYCHVNVGVAFGRVAGIRVGDAFELFGATVDVARFLRAHCPDNCVHTEASAHARPGDLFATVADDSLARGGTVTSLQMELPPSLVRTYGKKTVDVYSVHLPSVQGISRQLVMDLCCPGVRAEDAFAQRKLLSSTL